MARRIVHSRDEALRILATDPAAELQTGPTFAPAAGAVAMQLLQQEFPNLVIDVSASTGLALQCIRAGCRRLYTPNPSPELHAFATAHNVTLLIQ